MLFFHVGFFSFDLFKLSFEIYLIFSSVHGRSVVCYPLMFDVGDFYMAYDTQTLLDELQHTLQFIASYWRMKMRPLFIFLLREDDIQEERKVTMLEV